MRSAETLTGVIDAPCSPYPTAEGASARPLSIHIHHFSMPTRTLEEDMSWAMSEDVGEETGQKRGSASFHELEVSKVQNRTSSRTS